MHVGEKEAGGCPLVLSPSGHEGHSLASRAEAARARLVSDALDRGKNFLSPCL